MKTFTIATSSFKEAEEIAARCYICITPEQRSDNFAPGGQPPGMAHHLSSVPCNHPQHVTGVKQK